VGFVGEWWRWEEFGGEGKGLEEGGRGCVGLVVRLYVWRKGGFGGGEGVVYRN